MGGVLTLQIAHDTDYLYLLANSIKSDKNFVVYVNKTKNKKNFDNKIYYSSCDTNCNNMCDKYTNIFCSNSVDITNFDIYMMYIATGNSIKDFSNNTITGPYLYSSNSPFSFKNYDSLIKIKNNIYNNKKYLLNLSSSILNKNNYVLSSDVDGNNITENMNDSINIPVNKLTYIIFVSEYNKFEPPIPFAASPFLTTIYENKSDASNNKSDASNNKSDASNNESDASNNESDSIGNSFLNINIVPYNYPNKTTCPTQPIQDCPPVKVYPNSNLITIPIIFVSSLIIIILIAIILMKKNNRN